jgi:hypothetical protein
MSKTNLNTHEFKLKAKSAPIPPHYVLRRGRQYVAWEEGFTTGHPICARNWCSRREVDAYAEALNAAEIESAWVVLLLEAAQMEYAA